MLMILFEFTKFSCVHISDFDCMIIFRAPSLTMAYLMKHEKMTLLDAHTLVREKRSIIRPNPGFWRQLVEYEASLFSANTVEMRQHEKGGKYFLCQAINCKISKNAKYYCASYIGGVNTL